MASFSSDEAAFDAVLFYHQVIGEVVKNLPADVRAAMPEAEGSGPARMRDLIAHHHFAVDAEIIWEVATRRVPKILAQARKFREQVDSDESDTDESQ